MRKSYTFSCIIPVYKERDLKKSLQSVLKQKLSREFNLEKIFIVASGYKIFPRVQNKKIVLIEEKKRGGKARAIQLSLKKINSDFVLLLGGDVFLSKNSLKRLLSKLTQKDVGMVVAKPKPILKSNKISNFVNSLIWDLHDLVLQKRAKGGEAIVFKNLIKEIPKNIVTDEVYLESFLIKKGYRIEYEPKAIVYNKVPKSLSEIFKQRERVFIGHLQIRKLFRHTTSTMQLKLIISSLFQYVKKRKLSGKEFFLLFFVIFFEFMARLFAFIQFYFFKKIPYKWEVAKTKD